MTTTGIIGLESQRSIENLFLLSTNLLFKVKPPQRRFKWGRDEVDQFWKDITEAIERNAPDYFLGPILLVKDGVIAGRTTYSVIDGQQRLTVLGLTLAVCRDLCSRFGMPRSKYLHELLVRLDPDDNVEDLVFTPQDPDKTNYSNYISKKEATTEPQESNNKKSDMVRPALIRLKQLIETFLMPKVKTAGNPSQEEIEGAKTKLTELTNYLLKKVTLLPIDVGDEDQGYLIFDTANNRGKSLTQSEKIRAGLVHRLRERELLRKKFSDNWIYAGGQLESKDLPIDTMDRYLHMIWSSWKGYQAIQSLSITVLNDLPNGSNPNADGFITDIRDYVNDYTQVVAPELFNLSDNLKADLMDLKRLGFRQANGFLTMVYRNENGLFEKALQAALTLQVRNITIGSDRPSQYEKDWPQWSKLAREKKTKDALNLIEGKLRKDSEFKKDFLETPPLSASTIRHIIRKIDVTDHPTSGVSASDCDVEHIIPTSVITELKKSSASFSPNVIDWIISLGETVPKSDKQKLLLALKLEPAINKIGNQILWHKIPNRASKNNPFKDKVDSYKKMQITMTNEIGNKTTWLTTDVEERQEQLADSAIKAWPSKFL